jgi:hypothetical protein
MLTGWLWSLKSDGSTPPAPDDKKHSTARSRFDVPQLFSPTKAWSASRRIFSAASMDQKFRTLIEVNRKAVLPIFFAGTQCFHIAPEGPNADPIPWRITPGVAASM